MPEYTVTIRRQHRRNLYIRVVPGGFEVFIPHWMRKDNTKVRAFIQSGIEELQQHVVPLPPTKTSQDEIREMVAEWAGRIGVQPKRVQFRPMVRKWGSCSSRDNITLATGLTWLSPRLAEYVVCHELVHLRVFNHGPEFKALMSAHMPDWEDRLRELSAFDWRQISQGGI
jgi:predicted metal-dependent hydrolase